MYSLKKTVTSLMVFVIVIQSSYAEVSADVLSAVTSLQTTDPVLPTGVTNPKGTIGYILATIFGSGGSSLGKIQAQYLDTSGISGGSGGITGGTIAQYYRGDNTWATLDKGAVGLSSVDNTTDLAKPVSTATQTALNLKANLVSPALTGTPTAPTAALSDNSTTLATTAFVVGQGYLTATTLGNYYTKTNMQTSGQAQLHFNNLTNKPTTLSGYGITDGVDLTSTQTITGVKYFQSNKGSGSTVGGSSAYQLEAFSTDGGAAGMSFHRSAAYAVNFGLDPDNVLRIGGWSAAANRWQLDGNGNQTVAGNLVATGGYVYAINHLVTAANGNGICFWADCTNFKISMGSLAEYKYGPVTDYSIKNTVSNTAGRGWTWGTPGAVPVVAISTAGDMQIAGSLTVSTNIVSPHLSGAPTAATPVDGDNSTRVATTAWVKANTGGAGNCGYIGSVCGGGLLLGYTFSGETLMNFVVTPINTPSLNLAPMLVWSAAGFGSSGTTGTDDIWNGVANTNAMTTTTTPAGKFCYDLVYGGYSDWYLPAKNEVTMISPTNLAALGFVDGSVYWTSTQGSAGQGGPGAAYTYGFSSGGGTYSPQVSGSSASKQIAYGVRCVRRF